MDRPFMNLDECKDWIETGKGKFGERYSPISERIGAKWLGYSVTKVEPGKRACPFHNHHANEEMFLILEGQGSLRFGEETYELRRHDVIACPPGGPEVAHQIINTGSVELVYLCLSTKHPCDICEYPDSGKILAQVRVGATPTMRHMTKRGDDLDYYEGEL